MKQKKKVKNVKIGVGFTLFVLLFFCVAILRIMYLCLNNFDVGNINIKDFIEKRNMNFEIIMPSRGSIYDKTGTVLAQDVASYTVIAYLDPKRSVNSKIVLHVQDKEMTASKLAPLINMESEVILNLLNKENLYQVELGPGGRNISQSVMEEIKALDLPGIDFIKSYKRYYPNGDFASYTLGYTVKKNDKNDNEWIVGEMGIEGYYNDLLTGEVGYYEYEKDNHGYKIANGREYVEEAKNGNDVYLTIDNNIQLFVENAVKDIDEKTGAEWILMMVVDAKTGAVLGNSSTPSFDPNIRNMTNYLNPFVAYGYEPGSTMKIFSYMCAIDKGTYKGNDTYVSGSKSYVDQLDEKKVTTINDWNKKGWGTITYDMGFSVSSNIAVANLLETAINKNDLKKCYEKYGFGKKTNFTMGNEVSGKIVFNYPIETANAGFGQGISTTPIQHIQALSMIANDGIMLKPYIVSKIVDSDTKREVYVGEKTELGSIVSVSTVNKIKDMMYDVVNGDELYATGHNYKVDGYDVIGKTGTAQIYDYKTGKYSDDYTYSFSGMFPKDNPEIIIYAAMQKPNEGTSNNLANGVKNVISNVGNYLGIEIGNNEKSNSYVIDSYISKNVYDVKINLEKKGINAIILGEGDKIVKQYPSKNAIVYNNDRVFLLTDKYEKKIINLTGFSKKEVVNYLKLLGIDYEIEGNGYVYYQSITEDKIILDNDKLIIKLKPKY